jgi:spore coat polysaccharide biosynthesis predicted glycosyltransferase SpsG/ribosomal protein S18 acetylase RimI-like enzyme
VRVLMLCDGGGPLGVGHVIRSLALAEAAAAAGHQVEVAGQFGGSFLLGQLAAAPVELTSLGTPVAGSDPQQVIDLVRRRRPDVLHVDSYGAPDRLRELAAPAVLSNMEDGTFGRRPADVVIDPTFGAELSQRPEDGSTWLLRGSRFTPVRRRVVDARRAAAGAASADEPVPGQVARSVLVVMGGTDPVGLAPVAIRLLARTGLALDVTAIAVGENARQARAGAQGSALSLTVLEPVDDLASLMAGQDLVISAAGTSVWELCCLGVPAAVAWAVDNQHAGYHAVVAAGAAIGLGGPELGGPGPGGPDEFGQRADERAVDLLRAALTDSRVRADLVSAGRQVVDGLGAWRVVRTWEQAGRQILRPASRLVTGAGDLVARPATLQDARMLWHWRNDPATRAVSRSSAEVSWEDHVRWLTGSLTRTDRVLLVIEKVAGTAAGAEGRVGDVEAVGTVRWDLVRDGEAENEAGDEWEVSITVAPERRGQSLARSLLRAAELALSETTRASGADVSAYRAVVHVDNGASVRLFESSGYLPDLPPDPKGFMRFRKNARGTLRSVP